MIKYQFNKDDEKIIIINKNLIINNNIKAIKVNFVDLVRKITLSKLNINLLINIHII